MDFAGREKNLWEEALDIIRTTIMAERTIRYVTLSQQSDTAKHQLDDAPASDVMLKNLSLPLHGALT